MGLPRSAGEIQPQFRQPGIQLAGFVRVHSGDTDENTLAQDIGVVAPRLGMVLFHDFELASGSTPPAWIVTQDTSAAGSPSLDYDDNATCGSFSCAHDAQDEAQYIGLNGNDNLIVDPAKDCRFQGRVKLSTASMSADQRFVFGLASARDNNLDNVARNAWFRVEGGDAALLWEVDDGTTDDDDNSTGIDLVDDTYVDLAIEIREQVVYFFVNGAQVAKSGTMAYSGNLQFICEQQKDAGADTDGHTVDYIGLVGVR